MPPPVTTWTIIFSTIDYCSKRKRPSIQISAISYRKFIHFAFDEIKRHSHLVSSPLQFSQLSSNPYPCLSFHLVPLRNTEIEEDHERSMGLIKPKARLEVMGAGFIKVSPEISEALLNGQAITLERIMEVEANVREKGAVPATIAILDGIPCVGSSTEELARLVIFVPKLKSQLGGTLHTLLALQCLSLEGLGEFIHRHGDEEGRTDHCRPSKNVTAGNSMKRTVSPSKRADDWISKNWDPTHQASVGLHFGF
ncbi:hypothetical protein FEM48_Zijuj02G0047900 [Ziziphus jujuba var. spinosa]|uniref:Uncharacterized protein n=1 Tax=Ziziphus jujuba var. spinosa TaxID=714518 RepID=A0A978VTQ4_ZIZJJ|nr:hypothetical protein FEM48_Zijuj02G0047900 [Ziziphus jujuba var. spinosa]